MPIKTLAVLAAVFALAACEQGLPASQGPQLAPDATDLGDAINSPTDGLDQGLGVDN